MNFISQHETGLVCFWKHVNAPNSTASNKHMCAGIYQEPGHPASALSLLHHEPLKQLGATLKVEKTKSGEIVIRSGWGNKESKRNTYEFTIPKSGQIKEGDELPQRRKGPRSLVFPITPVNLNLQILMLQQATD